MEAAFTPDANGRAHLSFAAADGSSIKLYEQGGHLVSWKNKDGVDMLYTSPNAVFADRVAIRGGVPLIFPQFGNRGHMTPSHGFGRLRPWDLESVDPAKGEVVLKMQVPLDDVSIAPPHTPSTMSSSPKNVVVLTYTVTFSNKHLSLRMKVDNLSEEAAAHFHFAFHTYFHVSDISKTVLNGINRSPYYDQAKSRKNPDTKICKPQVTWRIQGEVDRIYPNQTCAVILQDPAKPHVAHISSETLHDVVVWNPGKELCATMKDLPEDGYTNFLCVEHGKIMERVTLPPQGSWVGAQEVCLLAARPESKI